MAPRSKTRFKFSSRKGLFASLRHPPTRLRGLPRSRMVCTHVATTWRCLYSPTRTLACDGMHIRCASTLRRLGAACLYSPTRTRACDGMHTRCASTLRRLGAACLYSPTRTRACVPVCHTLTLTAPHTMRDLASDAAAALGKGSTAGLKTPTPSTPLYSDDCVDLFKDRVVVKWYMFPTGEGAACVCVCMSTCVCARARLRVLMVGMCRAPGQCAH